jgi:hypothetical protein
MTAVPVPGDVPRSTGPAQLRGRLARWAVGLCLVSGVTFAISSAAIAIPYAVGEGSAVEDNWLAYALGLTAFAGLLGSLTAFVLAVVARLGPERGRLLWLPLGVFPAITLFLVLGEAFWWE